VTFESGLQRLLLALAVRGDVLSQAPEAVTPEAFGSGVGPTTPRQRLAVAVAAFWTRWQARPTAELLEQVVAEERRRLGPAEGDLLAAELAEVLATEIPEDPAWIYDRARQWANVKRVEVAVARAQAALQSPDPALGVKAALEAIASAVNDVDKTGVEQKPLAYLSSAPDRLRLWRGGLAFGQRIPTGLPELDEATGGGVARKETWYFLAPPKGAKTTFLMRAALGAARRGFGVYVATFEMQDIRMALRQDRAIARRSRDELIESTDELEWAVDALRQTGGEIHIEAWPQQLPGSVSAVKRRVEQLRKRGHRIDLVVLDYLHIMSPEKAEHEKRHELTRVSREIGDMGKALDVAVWCAALVNRKAVDKAVLRKADIAEAFEVIAVVDGMVAICGTPAMVAAGVRRLWVAAAREAQEETAAGTYRVDFERSSVWPVRWPTDTGSETADGPTM
jgi:hypothetical protein